MSVTSRPRLAAFSTVVAVIFLGLGAAAYGLMMIGMPTVTQS